LEDISIRFLDPTGVGLLEADERTSSLMIKMKGERFVGFLKLKIVLSIWKNYLSIKICTAKPPPKSC